VPGKIPHDMRRSSARNMTALGLPRQLAQDLMGHKTPQMFTRYNILDKDNRQAGADRLDGILGPVEVKPEVKLAAVVGAGTRRSR
jgi:integrase